MAGLLLGINAALAPGPLLVLTISETLRHGFKAGVEVALAPFITDLPVIVLVLVLLRKMGQSEPIMGLITLAGGVYLLFLAYGNFKAGKIIAIEFEETKKRKSFQKAIITNFLNPNPYLFWSTIGGGYLINGSARHNIVFLTIFYMMLVGGKVVLAFLAYYGRAYLQSHVYRFCMGGLGVFMLFFSGMFFYKAMKLLFY